MTNTRVEGTRKAALALIIVSALAAGHARAEDGTAAQRPRRDPAVESMLAADLEAIDSKLAERFHRATALMDRGEAAAAEQELRAVAAAAPRHAPTQWRLSSLAGRRGERREALAHGRRALELAPNAWQAKHTLAEALMMKGDLPSDIAQARVLVRALERERPTEETAALAVGLALQDTEPLAFGQALDRLRKVAPNGVATHYFTAVQAFRRDDLDAADAALTRAEAAGLPRAEADRLREASGISSHLRNWRWAKIAGVLGVVWLGGLLLVFVVGTVLSWRTLAAIEAFDGRDSAALGERTSALRRAYAFVIGFAAAYYYVSIPIVLAVLLLVLGGVVYFISVAQSVPGLLVVIALVAGGSIWAMLRALIVRRGRDEDPGRPLPPEQAPALWELLRGVASRVGTRSVDAVYLTLGTDLAVTELGSMSARLRDHGKRSLILGVGVLDGLTLQQLRAILAHEYGHFSHRDTAGGGLGMIVQTSLLKFAVGMAKAGGVAWYNPAWWFVRAYYALFLRITLGASRLQEIMADHFAAVFYGARAFSAGLAHVVRRSLEFDHNANLLVADAQQQAQPIASLYVTLERALLARSEIEQKIAERMLDPVSPYDSHPPVGKRMGWAAKVTASEEATPPDANEPAWTLFPDRAALEREMTDLANANLRAQGLKLSP